MKHILFDLLESPSELLDDEEDVSPVLPKLTLPSLQNDQLSDNLFKVLFDFSDIGITFAKDAIVLFGKLNLMF